MHRLRARRDMDAKLPENYFDRLAAASVRCLPAAEHGAMNPLAVHLCCGLGGWTPGLLAEVNYVVAVDLYCGWTSGLLVKGFYAVGLDVERYWRPQ